MLVTSGLSYATVPEGPPMPCGCYLVGDTPGYFEIPRRLHLGLILQSLWVTHGKRYPYLIIMWPHEVLRVSNI